MVTMPLFGPPNVVKMTITRDVNGLIKALEYQKDSDIRSAAARALGEVGGTMAIKPLFQLLEKEPVFYVRKSAISALGAIGDPSIIKPLCSLLVTGRLDDVDDTVEQVLLKFGPKSVEPLTAAIDSLPSRYHRRGDIMLEKLSEQSVEPFIGMAGDGTKPGRRTALKYLAELEDPRAIPVFIDCLSEDSEEIRSSAAYGLKLIGTPALDALIQVLSGENLNAKKAAIRLLRDDKNPQVVQPLIAQLSGKDMELRVIVMEALVHFGDPRAVEPIIDQLACEDPAVSQAAIESLGLLKDGRAVEPLITCLSSKDPDIRLKAIEALGSLADGRAVQPLIDKLAVETQSIRLALFRALGSIGSPLASAELTRILNEATDETVKIHCAAALANLGDPSAKDMLLTMLNDPATRSHTLEALSSTRNEDLINRIAGFFLVNGTIPTSWNRTPNPMFDDVEKFNAVGKALERIGIPAVPALITVMKKLIVDADQISRVDSAIQDQSPEVHLYAERTMKALDRIKQILGSIAGEYFTYPEEWASWWEKNKNSLTNKVRT